jgi:glycosyltransferase involved in cell wall biosynthesis
MNILYLISATYNPAYQGKFKLHDRYQTYGQHSFIYDFCAAASRKGIIINLSVEGSKSFPLLEPLRPYCNIIEFSGVLEPWEPDLILVDVVPDHLLELVPPGIPTFCVVHEAGMNYSKTFRERCDRFVCMTETAVNHQAKRVEPSKVVLIPQGVDTERFRPQHSSTTLCSRKPRILVYSRLDESKDTLLRVVEALASEDVELSVLGDGDAFWTISDRFGSRLTLINHIPCHSLHRFLDSFDVVVSSGRGVMEALASGLPAICAGFGYGGLVLPNNILYLLKRNLTGFGMGRDVSGIMKDVRAAMTLDWRTCRRMAENYCSVDRFIDQLTAAFVSL